MFTETVLKVHKALTSLPFYPHGHLHMPLLNRHIDKPFQKVHII